METGIKITYICVKTYIHKGHPIFCKDKFYKGVGNHITDEYGHNRYMSDDYIKRYFSPTITEPSDETDNVNHPKHYNSHPSGIECIEVTRHYCFSIGNAIKYLWRAGLKEDSSLSSREKEIEDLKKAIWYINDRIKFLNKND